MLKWKGPGLKGMANFSVYLFWIFDARRGVVGCGDCTGGGGIVAAICVNGKIRKNKGRGLNQK